MGNALIGYANAIGRATLSGGAWYPTLPESNLQTEQPGEIARTTSLVTSATRIDFSWPTLEFLRVVALGYHNLSLTALARVQLAADADFAEIVYDSGWGDVWPSVYPFGSIPWGAPNWWTGQYTLEEIAAFKPPLRWILPEPQSAQYGRILIDDPDNAAGYVQAGKLFAGPAVQFARSFVYGGALGWADLSESQRALSGARYFTRRPKYRTAEVEWNTLTEDAAMTGMFELQRLAGLTEDVLFVWNPDDTYHAGRRTFFATLSELPRLTVTNPDIWNAPAAFEERL